MYKHLNKTDYQKFLNVPENYSIDGLIVTGAHPKNKEYPHIYEALKKLGLQYTEEKIEQRFFGDIKSFKIGNKRIWFDVVYGAAYLSEIVHLACLFESKTNILLGSCGALKQNLNSGDTIIPSISYGNESATRMYQRENTTYMYESNPVLRTKIKNHLFNRDTIDEGKLVTVQAMLGETKEDIDQWIKEDYSGVDMESATFFAVSKHFGVPAAALLLVADNLVKNELVNDPGYEALRSQRTTIRKENYEIALNIILDL
ncbi:MAG TPA: hypothetical protein PK367_02135 [Candidatus Paceibacterota bacterium]|nr:hypothetical protein [Candidatus Paceibacterota bacterium]